MKEKRYLVLLFLTCFSITAQIKGFVVDDKNQPIPYVNIWVENENIGTTSEENGSFTIYVEDQNKVLVLSALGFEIKKVAVSDAEKVVLKQIAFELDEVVISKSKKEITRLIGDSKSTSAITISGRAPWIYAKLFKYEIDYLKTPYIKNVIIYTYSDIKNASFKLRVYKVKKDGLPGEDFIKEDIVVFVKKGTKKNIIELSKYNLDIPKEGIFVAFEWMLIENNKIEFKYNNQGLKKTIKDFEYAPSLVFNYKDRDLTVTYSNGGWNKRPKINFEENKSVRGTVIEPAINLTLTN
jgi:hypothetical protein